MLLEVLVAILVLVNLHMLGTSRLGALIKDAAVQAFLVCALALSVRETFPHWHELVILAATLIVKGVVLPWLMYRALRKVVINREIEPLVGYSVSLLAGLAFLAFSVFAGLAMPLPVAGTARLAVSVSIFSIAVGLFLVVSRTKAITQAVGYLTMENGIYALGLSAAASNPLVVEMGVLLDIFVGVFVMGILIHHINREFDHIDTHSLTSLKE